MNDNVSSFILLSTLKKLLIAAKLKQKITQANPILLKFLKYVLNEYSKNEINKKINSNTEFIKIVENALIFPTENLYKILQLILNKVNNLLNLYAKLIGVEIAAIYLSQNIMRREKINEKYYYILNVPFKHHLKCMNLPDLVRKKIKLNYSIENDQMLSKIKNPSIWDRTLGDLTLNVNFIKELTQFLFVFSSKPNAKKNIEFINYIYDTNLNCYKNTKYFSKILKNALDLKKIKRVSFKTYPSTWSIEILNEIKNKIYQKKHMLILWFTYIKFLLSFDHFTLNIIFDARGRGYPDVSDFSYLAPFAKYSLNFKQTHYETEKEKQEALDTVSAAFLANYLNGDLNIDQVNLLNLSKNRPKNLFLTYILFMDLCGKTLAKFKNEYRIEFDANNSAAQIIALLMRSRKLGLLCGLLIDSQPTDIYTEFVGYVQTQIKKNTIIFEKYKNNPLFLNVYYFVRRFSRKVGI